MFLYIVETSTLGEYIKAGFYIDMRKEKKWVFTTQELNIYTRPAHAS